jgi:GT2 family glycosyltransferase
MASTASYVVFIDGDCILPRDFVAQHRALAEPGWFVAGNRMLLSPGFTEQVEQGDEGVDLDEPLVLLRHRLLGHVNRVLPRIRLSAQARWRYRAPQRWQGARTCNLAVWRQDLLAVDGFDEAYSGWGMEDSDLVIRLLKHGVRHKDGRYATGVYHLWHRENDRSRLAENVARLQALQQGSRIRAEQGLSQPVPVSEQLSVVQIGASESVW